MNATETLCAVGIMLVLGLAGSAMCSCSSPRPAYVRGSGNVTEEAASLRHDFDCVHIYSVVNGYEVWKTGSKPVKLKDAKTLSEARRAVNDYYVEWAMKCLGPTPNGNIVE